MKKNGHKNEEELILINPTFSHLEKKRSSVEFTEDEKLYLKINKIKCFLFYIKLYRWNILLFSINFISYCLYLFS